MPLENAPIHQHDNQDGIRSDLAHPNKKRRAVRLIILALLVLVAILAAVNFLNSDTAGVMMGKGSLTGQVFNAQGTPLPAEIFILGTDLQAQAAPDGSFTLDGVPEGQRALVAGHDGHGVEVDVSISAGQTTNLGQIRIVTTLTP